MNVVEQAKKFCSVVTERRVRLPTLASLMFVISLALAGCESGSNTHTGVQPATAQESSTYECYGTSRPVSTLEEAQKNIGKWVCSIPPGSGNIPRNARIKYAEDIYGQITYVIVYDDNGMEDRAAANSVRFIGE